MEVVNATDSNFVELLKNNEKIIVKYYAGWCGSCRLITPKFNSLASKEEYDGVMFLNVDAENSPNARSLAKVNNLPYFAGFKNGALVEGFPSAKIEVVEELINKL